MRAVGWQVLSPGASCFSVVCAQSLCRVGAATQPHAAADPPLEARETPGKGRSTCTSASPILPLVSMSDHRRTGQAPLPLRRGGEAAWYRHRRPTRQGHRCHTRPPVAVSVSHRCLTYQMTKCTARRTQRDTHARQGGRRGGGGGAGVAAPALSIPSPP